MMTSRNSRGSREAGLVTAWEASQEAGLVAVWEASSEAALTLLWDPGLVGLDFVTTTVS
jgi:hypothetical protein